MTTHLGPGVPDADFQRGDVPMSKMEVRAVTIAKARLPRSARVLDIGAGTGGLTVDAALTCPDGEVVALERNPNALELLRANIEAFELPNVRVVEGEAPAALASFGDGRFDAVLLGGTGGHMAEIIAELPRLLVPSGRVVSNTIGLASTSESIRLLRADPWTAWDAVQVAVSRAEPIGADLRLVPLNPVWIVSATLCGEAL